MLCCKESNFDPVKQRPQRPKIHRPCAFLSKFIMSYNNTVRIYRNQKAVTCCFPTPLRLQVKSTIMISCTSHDCAASLPRLDVVSWPGSHVEKSITLFLTRRNLISVQMTCQQRRSRLPMEYAQPCLRK